jgi:hypothetical protein
MENDLHGRHVLLDDRRAESYNFFHFIYSAQSLDCRGDCLEIEILLQVLRAVCALAVRHLSPPPARSFFAQLDCLGWRTAVMRVEPFRFSMRASLDRTCRIFAGLLAILLCFAPAFRGFATGLNPAMAGVESYDPLQHSHLIVRGIVTDIRQERSSFGKWGIVPQGSPQSSVPMQVTKVFVTISDLLKGTWAEDNVAFALSLQGEDVLFGLDQEFIICGKWQGRSDGGVFVTGSHLGVYRKEGFSWVRRVMDVAITPAETLTNDQVIQRIRQSSLGNVTHAADVIARGTIIAAWESSYDAGSGLVGAMRHYKLRVADALKGIVSEEYVEFVVPRIDVSYVPKWYRDVPRGIGTQQEWLVFLRRDERGMYPFAGTNSLLKVEGEELIYDMAVKYPDGLRAAVRKVRSEVAGGP